MVCVCVSEVPSGQIPFNEFRPENLPHTVEALDGTKNGREKTVCQCNACTGIMPGDKVPLKWSGVKRQIPSWSPEIYSIGFLKIEGHYQ